MEERCGASSTDARLLERLPQLRLGEPVLVDVDDLVLDAGMRYNGEDPSHSRVLAAIGDVLPPIFVHQPSMIVLDGVHRVRATRRMGHARILARLVSGSLADAFVLGVRANTAHGKPLTLAERERCIRICEARAELWQKTLAARSEVAYARDEARSRSNEARAIRDLIEAAAEEPQADA